MKLYLAGPMSSKPNLNFPAFHMWAKKLRSMGHEVINPAEINGGADEIAAVAGMDNDQYQKHWQKCMKKDIAGLVECDGIAMMHDWKYSKGATIEHDLAATLGMEIMYLPECL